MCLWARIWFHHHNVISSAKNCQSSFYVSAKKNKREYPRYFVFSAPQTKRNHILMLFELCIKGPLAFFNFWDECFGCFWPSHYVYKPFFGKKKEITMEGFGFTLLYSLDLLLAGSLLVWSCIYVILCTFIICIYFCGQLAWCKKKTKDLYSWYLHTFSSVRAFCEDKKKLGWQEKEVERTYI